MLSENFIAAARKVQEELQESKEKFDSKKFDYSYQNDSVKIEILGSKRIIKLEVKEELLSNKTMLEAILMSSINDAHDNVAKEFEKIVNDINTKHVGSLEGLIQE